MSNNWGCSCGNSWRRHDHTPCHSCHNDRERRNDWHDNHKDDRHDWRDERRDDRHDNHRDDRHDGHRHDRCDWCNHNNFWPWR